MEKSPRTIFFGHLQLFGLVRWFSRHFAQICDRDLESSSTMKKVNAWVCALLTTDHDPARVLPDNKRKT